MVLNRMWLFKTAENQKRNRRAAETHTTRWRINTMRIELETPDQKKKTSSSDSFIPPKDEKRTFKTEFAKMKEMGFKEGFKYFWYYYRNTLLVIVLCIICAVSLVTTIIRNKRPYVIEVQLYNNYVNPDVNTDDFCLSFAEHMGKNLDDYQMLFTASDMFDPETMSEEMQATFYKFAAMIAASELDIIGGDRTFVDYYAQGMTDEVYFYDMKTILPEDLYTYFEENDMFYYSNYLDENGAVIGKYASAIDASESRLTDEAGLLITPVYVGVACNTGRLEESIEFIRWIFYLDDGDAEAATAAVE